MTRAAPPRDPTGTATSTTTDGDAPDGGLRALVVIPTYQEALNLEEVLRRIRAAAPTAHVLVVDDNSPDGTADLAAKLAVELGEIEVLRHGLKRGLGAAYRAGFALGLERGYDLLVEMDADLSHDPDALPSLLDAAPGADLVIGSRYIPGGAIPDWPWHRRALSRYGNRYAASVLRLRATDATSGFRAFRAPTLDAAGYARTHATGYAFQIELAYQVARLGGTIAEVPIVFSDRVRGRSKMSARIAVEAMALVTWWAVRDRLLRRRPPPLEPFRG
jgi:dolichol-phosphate mannosyltransferase